MKRGVNCIGDAQLCPVCHADMMQDFVIRDIEGHMKTATCERCGKRTLTMRYLYTMKGKVKERLGLLDAPPM